MLPPFDELAKNYGHRAWNRDSGLRHKPRLGVAASSRATPADPELVDAVEAIEEYKDEVWRRSFFGGYKEAVQEPPITPEVVRDAEWSDVETRDADYRDNTGEVLLLGAGHVEKIGRDQ